MNHAEGRRTQAERGWTVSSNAWTMVGYWLLFALLFGAALVVRLYRLDAQPLWLDEGTTWAQVTRSRISALTLDLFRPTQAYPLFHLVLKVSTRLLGDSEWALRFPSAIAGALAVPALFALGRELRDWVLGLGAALLLLGSPFAIWQSQDAKAYSLTLLVAIVLAWSLARALRTDTRGSWLLFAAIAAIAPFTHRLLVFSLLGCVVAWALMQKHKHEDQRRNAQPGRVPALSWLVRPVVVLAGTAVMGIGLVAAMALSLRYQNAGGQFAAVGPGRAAWLTFWQFAVGQWPGALARRWLLPFGLLTLLGGARLLLDLRYGRNMRGAPVVLALGLVPALLFGLLLSFQSAFEARYLTIVFPFWLLALAWALPEMRASRAMSQGSRDKPASPGVRFLAAGSGLLALGLLAAALFVDQRALYLPDKGIFSGATVKEDYRSAVHKLADHVHPDDLVVVHPDTILPLYEYYAPRVSPQPLPKPTTYGWLGRAGNDPGQELRSLDSAIRAELRTAKRAWLLIAPEHARVVDPPRTGDLLGLVGLAFQYGDQNRRLQCGEPQKDRAYAGFVGVLLYCNNMPDFNGATPQPEVAQPALFGDALRLRGYTITPFESGIRAGGTLPISLFWEPLASLADTDYVVFIHLTQPDDPKPLAQIDGRPMEGGLPTSLWTEPSAELHDDRTMRLVDQDGQPLPPGRYTLRLGVYRAEDGQRLTIRGTTQPVQDNAMVLGEVEVLAADAKER